MTFSTTPSDLVRVLDPAAATTRGSYSRMRRPWTPGYAARLDASAAGLLFGFDAYHPNDAEHVIRMQGLGQAPNAAPFLYTVPAGTLPQLPVTADVTEADDYLDCVALVYPNDSRSDSADSMLERIATGGGNVTRAMFRVQSATTFNIAVSHGGGLYSDVPPGWTIEIQVPPASAIVGMYDGTAPTAVFLKDFLAAGGAGKTGVLSLNRVFS
jgi:hypothetical protein